MPGSWFEWRSGDTSGEHGCGCLVLTVIALVITALFYSGMRLIA